MIQQSLPAPFATDGELLYRFCERNDESAFESLVRRHARLVFTVCRRVLRHEQDVEDAFQAAFLVLVKRARSLRSRDSVAAWLFKVAHRIALRAAQRRQHDGGNTSMDVTSTDGVLEEVEAREEFDVLAAELDRLPETYRLPLVLHYLEGRSRAATAEQLDCTEASVKARLARGRRMLRRRLMRRGVALSIVMGTASGAAAAATPPAALVATTVTAATHFSATGLVGTAGSAGSLELSQGLSTMFASSLGKISAIAGTTLAATLVVAVGVAVSQAPTGTSPSERAAAIDTRVEIVGGEVAPADETASSQETVRTGVDASDGVADESIVNVEIDDDRVGRQSSPEVDFKTRRPNEVRIAEALDETTEIQFIDVPIRDVVEFLSELHAIPILIDAPGLEEEGVTTDEPISLHVGDLTMESGLNLILDPLNLEYVIENEVLMITSSARAWERMEPRVYSLRRLLDAGILGADVSSQELESILLAPEDERLGNESLSVIGDFLVLISQSQPAHRRTVDILEQLGRAADEAGGAAPRGASGNPFR